jgi:hypothetical protein
MSMQEKLDVVADGLDLIAKILNVDTVSFQYRPNMLEENRKYWSTTLHWTEEKGTVAAIGNSEQSIRVSLDNAICDMLDRRAL